MKSLGIIFTAEHGGKEIPEPYQYLFTSKNEVLESYPGCDEGAVEIADVLSDELGGAFLKNNYSRLLVDLNMSLEDPAVFSKYTAELDQAAKEHLIEEYHNEYWKELRGDIKKLLVIKHQVLHISVRTFVPGWQGIAREVDIGFTIADRDDHPAFCDRWKKH